MEEQKVLETLLSKKAQISLATQVCFLNFIYLFPFRCWGAPKKFLGENWVFGTHFSGLFFVLLLLLILDIDKSNLTCMKFCR